MRSGAGGAAPGSPPRKTLSRIGRHSVGQIAPRLAALALTLCVLVGGRAAAEPERASMGIYLAGVHGLDFAAGKYSADFWLWSTVTTELFSPVETAYIVNEADKSPEPTQTIRSADKRWDQRRIRADLWADWNVERFPFDYQVLTIAVEESFTAADHLTYVADNANSGIDPTMTIPGWRIVGWDIASEEHRDASNFGNPAKDSRDRSARLVFRLTIQRDGLPLFLDLTLGAFVAFAIMAISFRLQPMVPPIFGARMVIIVASLFTAIASMRLNSSSFAFTFGSALPVRIHLVTLAAGFLAALGAVIARHHVQSDNEVAALRFDRRALPLFVAAYLIVIGWMIFDAVLHH
jgi:hypothetical protein